MKTEEPLSATVEEYLETIYNMGVEDEVVIGALRAVGAVVAGDVGLTAEDGFDAVLLGAFEEIDGAEHVAVIGDRARRHPELRHPFRQRLGAARAVEK